MAVAGERLGIGIRRHFTTESRHPYGEVVWELRDSRISDYRTGAVAFEQPGVEVPSTWSLNATNILAQKYFRGTVGMPGREHSLRQIVDRVVDTITAWGLKDGYFVDSAEAAIFSDELKHLVVQQKAAFNSPVWFNIGVEGVPQQAAACQPYDALVSTPGGPVPIGRLVEDEAVGQKVFDADGLTRIVAVKANGRKHVLRVTTKAGHQLDVTADHLVWRASGEDTGRFVPAAELQVGDQLSWHRTDSSCEGEISGRLDITGIEDVGEMDVFDIQTESGEYLSSRSACSQLLHPGRRGLDGLHSQLVRRGGHDLQRWVWRGSQPFEHPVFPGAASRGRDGLGARELHARGGRLCRNDQVRRQDASRGKDGDPGCRPPGHPRVHLVQGP